jgi:hypothetical protein
MDVCCLVKMPAVKSNAFVPEVSNSFAVGYNKYKDPLVFCQDFLEGAVVPRFLFFFQSSALLSAVILNDSGFFIPPARPPRGSQK